MTPGGNSLQGRRGTAASILAVLLLFTVRFHELVLGGVLSRRDAGFFFVPWRAAYARLLSASELPLWNDLFSSGRALAANPTGAVFWPLSPLILLFGTTGLVLVNAALLLALFVVALRWLRLGAAAAAAGGAILLFSGVFQSLPLYFGMPAAAAPLPLAVVAMTDLDPADRRGSLRRIAVAALAIGLSLFGGEPVVTLMGIVATATVGLWIAIRHLRAGRPKPAALCGAALAAALLLAGLFSAVQLLPAARELSRSARGQSMRAEEGSLYWSVRPSRLLTLLEPRLVGDAFAERSEDYWGAGTFDAGNPYFTDLALGLVPLLFCALSFSDPRGLAALLLGGLAAALSLGRYLPGYLFVAPRLSVFRYPEKWWLLATIALATAAAVGVHVLSTAGDEKRRRLLRRLSLCAGVLALPVALAAALAIASPAGFHELLWGLGLGVGASDPLRPAAALAGLLLATTGSLLVTALVSELVRAGRIPIRVFVVAVSALFFLNAARRVSGSCPAGERELFTKKTDLVSRVASESAGARFHDDGASNVAIAVRRFREVGGFDPLFPETGSVFGLRYAGENDVDRMSPAENVRWSVALSAMPWGQEKVTRLAAAGVRVVRTSAPAPDPAGVTELLRTGEDRIVRLERPRAEFALVPQVWVVPDAAQAWQALTAPGRDPLLTAIVECPGKPNATRQTGVGTVTVVEKHASAQRLRVTVAEPGGLLAIARTFDPSWTARIDGALVPSYRSETFLTALFVPPGTRDVELRYENPSLRLGAWISLAAAAVLAAMLFASRPARP